MNKQRRERTNDLAASAMEMSAAQRWQNKQPRQQPREQTRMARAPNGPRQQGNGGDSKETYAATRTPRKQNDRGNQDTNQNTEETERPWQPKWQPKQHGNQTTTGTKQPQKRNKTAAK